MIISGSLVTLAMSLSSAFLHSVVQRKGVPFLVRLVRGHAMAVKLGMNGH